jgi:Uma2 family endonuclease
MSNWAEKEDYYTYKDYSYWPEEDRYELMYGIPYMMSSPTEWHQRILMSISNQLWNFLEGKKCSVYCAPFDVRLFPQDDDMDDTVVQPDILVVCDKSKLADGKSCKGAPDLVIEICSDSTRKRDILVKRNLYFKAGVKEYWVVDKNTLNKYVLVDGVFQETAYVYGDKGIKLEAAVLPGCVLKI